MRVVMLDNLERMLPKPFMETVLESEILSKTNNTGYHSMNHILCSFG